ncbi:hypothetical protein [Mesorhizobium sp. M7A.F.Ca.MR.245.00.0.0]|nr:hypothetical protein [Mesorhizobium sp. M7A.F.Ca.MR.245.00.0.0]
MTKRKYMCSQEGRSALTSRIRRSDIAVIVRHLLHALGYRFRIEFALA